MSIDDDVLLNEKGVVEEEECEHFWMYVADWEGNPEVPNGTRDVSYWKCLNCDEETTEQPEGFEDQIAAGEYEPTPPDDYDDDSVDYEYDPFRNCP